MPYRRNSDELVRQLERQYQTTQALSDFLVYRRALARTGHRNILLHRRGVFLVSISGGTIDYIKKSGPTYSIIVNSWNFDADNFFIPELEKKKGMRITLNSQLLKSWYVVIPPELVAHIRSLIFQYYRKEIATRVPDARRESGLAIYALTQTPHYQENLYKLIIQELESLGYYQQNQIPEIFCDKGCGRSMGLSTPARQYNKMCFYCWRALYNFDQKWLDDQLTRNQSHAPQYRKNPIDETIRELEQQTAMGDLEACFQLINLYQNTYPDIRIFQDRVDRYIEDLLSLLDWNQKPRFCDQYPVVRIDPWVGTDNTENIYGLVRVVKKYKNRDSKEIITIPCCSFSEGYYASLSEAEIAAKELTRIWITEDPLQPIYIKYFWDPVSYRNILLANLIIINGSDIPEMRLYLQ